MNTPQNPTITVKVGEIASPMTYERLQAVIEAYKVKNPEKYEKKKASLEKQLADLKKVKPVKEEPTEETPTEETPKVTKAKKVK